MPTVNERCKILRSLNRVYVLEIVLLLVPRLKILRRRGLSYFGIFEKQRGTVEFPRNKPQQPFRGMHALCPECYQQSLAAANALGKQSGKRLVKGALCCEMYASDINVEVEEASPVLGSKAQGCQ